MNKKMFVLFLAVVMVVSTLLVGCGSNVDNTDETYDEQVENNDSPPPKENKPINATNEHQYVRDGKFYLSELFIFDFTSTSNGESRPGYSWKGDFFSAAIKQLAEYKKSDDIHNDKIEQCVFEMVELKITSPEDIFHIKNGDIVIWEATINQDVLEEFNSYIDGIEVVVEPTYTVTAEGLTE